MNMTGFQNADSGGGARFGRSYQNADLSRRAAGQSYARRTPDTAVRKESYTACFEHRTQENFSGKGISGAEDARHRSFREALCVQHGTDQKMNLRLPDLSENTDYESAGYKEYVNLYQNELQRALFSQNPRNRGQKEKEEHVLFQPEDGRTGVFSKKTLADAAGFPSDAADIMEEDEGSLTEDLIRYFKEKYDVEHMNAEEYEEFLAEVKEKKLLSDQEVERQLFRPLPPCTAMVMPAFRDLKDTHEGNYLAMMLRNAKEAEYILDMIRQGQCSVSPESSLSSVRAFYENEKEYYEKIADLYSKFKRSSGNIQKSEAD